MKTNVRRPKVATPVFKKVAKKKVALRHDFYSRRPSIRIEIEIYDESGIDSLRELFK